MASGLFMPAGHMVIKFKWPAEIFICPTSIFYKPCKAYVYCLENKYMPRLKNHLSSWALNQKVYVPWDQISVHG